MREILKDWKVWDEFDEIFVKIGGDEDLIRKWEQLLEFLRDHKINQVRIEI